MRSNSWEIFNADNSASSDGVAQNVNQVVSASFQVTSGDTDIDGTLKIQMSNDAPPNGNLTPGFEPTNWSDISGATTTITNGVAGPIVIANMCFSFIRATLTAATPGSSTTVVRMNVLSV